ncbi:MAG: cell division protein CrgA, partial [Trebonia sp.]
MPKSKVRKKSDAPVRSVQALNPSSKALSPSPTWYPAVMGAVLILGLAYLV